MNGNWPWFFFHFSGDSGLEEVGQFFLPYKFAHYAADILRPPRVMAASDKVKRQITMSGGSVMENDKA
jgi:hypothetical protein